MKRPHFLKALLALPFVPKNWGTMEPANEVDLDLLLGDPIPGKTFYVDPEFGDDTKDGLSSENALRSTPEALNRLSGPSDKVVRCGWKAWE